MMWVLSSSGAVDGTRGGARGHRAGRVDIRWRRDSGDGGERRREVSSVRVLVGIDDPAITGEDGRGGNTGLGTKASAAAEAAAAGGDCAA